MKNVKIERGVVPLNHYIASIHKVSVVEIDENEPNMEIDTTYFVHITPGVENKWFSEDYVLIKNPEKIKQLNDCLYYGFGPKN